MLAIELDERNLSVLRPFGESPGALVRNSLQPQPGLKLESKRRKGNDGFNGGELEEVHQILFEVSNIDGHFSVPRVEDHIRAYFRRKMRLMKTGIKLVPALMQTSEFKVNS